MKDLGNRHISFPSTISPKIILLIFLGLLLICSIVLIIMYANGTTIEANDTIYSDGKLKTIVSYNDDKPREVWIQHVIYQEDGILSQEKIGEVHSEKFILKKGLNEIEYEIPLSRGDYKLFIYISTTDDTPQRLAGFIKNICI